jgi:Tfp pilus assembly protein PilX
MRPRRTRAGRRGLTAVAVLVCLLIVTLISAALLKVGVARRGELKVQERRVQAEWLAQAGLDRALHRLTASRDYAGERWTLSAADLNSPPAGVSAGEPAGVVRISIERPASAPAEQRLIQVQADYPPDPPRRARHSLRMLVDLGSLRTGALR